MTLRQLRKEKGLTQKECAEYLGVGLRTYVRYENEEARATTREYGYMKECLEKYGLISETLGVLSVDKIKQICTQVFSDFPVEFCYLFGSYAKGSAGQTSDVDLLISTSLSGLMFYELVETLREKLQKRVDVIHQSQLRENYDLTNEILKDGIKIYG